MIHMMVHDTVNASNSIRAGIYAPTHSRGKNVFWDHLNIIDIPWYLIGDFNDLVCSNDKLGGPTPYSNGFQRLNRFLTCINAEILQVTENFFCIEEKGTHLLSLRMSR